MAGWFGPSSGASLLQSIEGHLSSVTTPFWSSVGSAYEHARQQYPNLSLIGSIVVVGGSLLIAWKYRKKNRVERESEKERNLDSIPGIKRDLQTLSGKLDAVDRNMLGVTGAANNSASATLGLNNNFSSIMLQLREVLSKLDENGKTLLGINKTANAVHEHTQHLPAFGRRLETVEGLQRSAASKLEEIDGFVRPRSKTQ
ncbi:MAG: hypothetical protein JSR17_03645 [Proteobacteria bacterium]|nr:hypothetical protein [Pseudomonadota bacterium]